jgi:phosphoglycerol transferase MdoB-like AlkP superfamily enzyme
MDLIGGMPPLCLAWRLEIPLILCLYYYFNSITRPSKWQPLVAALPIVLVYGIFEANFMSLGRLLRIIEVKEFPELLNVLPVWIIISTGVIFSLSFIVFIKNLQSSRIPGMILGIFPFLFLVLMVEAAPDYFLFAFERVQKPVTEWSDIQSAEDNGRIWMMLYHEAKRNSNLKKIADYQDDPAFIKKTEDIVSRLQFLETRKNVHLIVLESFVDPELFKGLSFSRKPMHPDFEKIFKKQGSLTISPVFGGGTAQAEFELLCGVPALRKMSGMEFDVFTGNETYSLPALLAKAGYHTLATNAYKPDFFNSINAYSGLGFKKSYYPQEYASGRDSYLSTGDVTGEKYMFDGDLLKQNLAFISDWKASNPGVPLFNYVISIYGHFPHQMNTQKRPTVIDVKGAIRDGHLENCINQFYYRTQALAEFINQIKILDPESLVIFISDHLPWVYGPETYKKLGYAAGVKDFEYINRVFFFEDGRAVHYDKIHHYDIPDLILNYITGKSHCKDYPCSFKTPKKPVAKEEYEKAYMTIMANAMK